MLVVIPVCQKDEALVLKNLDWIAELDGKIESECVVSYPDNFNSDRVICAAETIFSKVYVLSYQEWSGNMLWPNPQNWAWQSTARYMANHAKSWLWWEADSTPVAKGWVDIIREEYARGGKPFMGCVMDERDGHMNGVGVYPPNVSYYSMMAMLCRSVPFDVAAGREIAQYVHRANHLIQHHCCTDGDSTHFPDFASVESIVRPGVVLFHRCKDGSLIERLRESRSGFKKLVNKVTAMFSSSKITVVITNFNRPDKVKCAFESCLKAGVEHVIVSASGCGDELKAVHQQFKRDKPNVVIDAIPVDFGCNEMWLRGARKVKTEWTHILHDDDMLLPEFRSLEKLLDRNAGFYHWDGAKHAWPDTLLKDSKAIQRTFDNRSHGIYPTSLLWSRLLTPGGYSLSPVSALFRREHVIEVLEEVEREFSGCQFFWGPKMQVGNDLLLWLRAVETYANFYYIPRPLISYGHWDGSVTFWDYGCALGKLGKIYDHTRDYFLCGPPFPMLNSRRMVHIQSNYLSVPDEVSRVQFARKQWTEQYRCGQWTREGIDDNGLPRMFKDGNRDLPYVRDMIDQAVNKHGDDPIYVLTNTDTIPIPSLTRHLIQTFEQHECCYSFRRDISANEKRDERSIRMQSAVYPGCDLFAFSKRWWQKARKEFPDMLYATDTWDYALHKYMDSTGGKRFYHLIYHVVHGCELHRNKGSVAHKHNHDLAAPFLSKLGIEPFWLSDKPVNLNPR